MAGNGGKVVPRNAPLFEEKFWRKLKKIGEENKRMDRGSRDLRGAEKENGVFGEN